MALTIGATHVVTGTGQFAVATPAGLSISTTGIPAYVARDPGTPTLYHHVGKFSLGHVYGWQHPIDLELVPQLVYPLAREFTLVGYTLLAGVTATFAEVVGPTTLSDPWDRNPAMWSIDSHPAPGGGTGDTLAWTYAVPTARKLMVTHLEVRAQRVTAASSLVYASPYIQLGSGIILRSVCLSNVFGTEFIDSLTSGPLVVPAGVSLTARYGNQDTGGQVYMALTAAGMLFDA
jgi:hypothetical protein